jgi:hypothetical protein
MALASADWKVLRGAIVMTVVSVIISGGLLYGGRELADKADLQYRRDYGSYQGARARYLTLDDQQRTIEEFYPRYQGLEEAGMIGDERRLSWIETLRNMARGLKVSQMRYEISSQEEFEPAFELPRGTFKVYTTDMNLSAGLLHEADLPAMLAALDEAAEGMFSVAGCSMQVRANAFPVKPEPRNPNVIAECRLQWFIVRKPEPRS